MAEQEPIWIPADQLYEIHAKQRNDEWGDGGELDIWHIAVRHREALLGECLHRFRLAITATFLGKHGECEDILAAAVALLVEHDVVDPTEGPET